MKTSHLLLVLCTILGTESATMATAPPLLSYQGILRDAVGDDVPDGNYSVTFRIWDSGTGGTALWQEGRLVTVQGGLFTVLLGSIVPIPDTLFRNPARWIGLQVGLDAEMAPGQRLVSVPFAWESQHADEADTACVAQRVDTTGYSAYVDMVSEGRIGEQTGQVAAGDHIHSLAEGASHLMRVEDTTNFFVAADAGGLQFLMKQVIIPESEVGRFIRVSGSARGFVSGGAGPNLWLKMDSVSVLSGVVYQQTFAFDVELHATAQGSWRGLAIYSGYDPSTGGTRTWVVLLENLYLNAADGLVVEIVGQSNSGPNPPTELSSDHLIVIYDKD